MVHGYPGRPHDFRFLFPHMKNFRCIALAMPNLDISTTKTDVPITTIVDRENAIIEFLNAMNISECILMGHSMGGPMVLSATCNHPEKNQRTHHYRKCWCSRISCISEYPSHDGATN